MFVLYLPEELFPSLIDKVSDVLDWTLGRTVEVALAMMRIQKEIKRNKQNKVVNKIHNAVTEDKKLTSYFRY